MRLRIGFTAAFLAVCAITLSVTPAEARVPQTSVGDRVKHKLLAAPDPTAGVNSLTAEELAFFRASMNNLTPTTVVLRSERFVPSAAQRSAMNRFETTYSAARLGVARAHSVAAGGCWKQYWYVTWKDFSFITTGDTWMQLEWCSNGRAVTTWSVPIADGAGEHGNAYHGVSSMNSISVGWEVRQYVKFNFSYGPIHAYPCMQLRGGATGLYSKRKDCNLG